MACFTLCIAAAYSGRNFRLAARLNDDFFLLLKFSRTKNAYNFVLSTIYYV